MEGRGRVRKGRVRVRSDSLPLGGEGKGEVKSGWVRNGK